MNFFDGISAFATILFIGMILQMIVYLLISPFTYRSALNHRQEITYIEHVSKIFTHFSESKASVALWTTILVLGIYGILNFLIK